MMMLYNLISVLFFCSFSVTAFAATPQVPIHPLDECPAPPSGWPPCGFRYSGIYRLINYGFQNAATLNDSTPGAAILSMPIKFDDLAQLWNIVFIDDSQTVMIINRATGAALTAVESRKAVQGVHVLPYDKRAHWTMDLTTFGDVDGVPITFANVGVKGVLDLSKTTKTPGAHVLVYPKNDPVTRNQGWYVEYMSHRAGW